MRHLDAGVIGHLDSYERCPEALGMIDRILNAVPGSLSELAALY